jgi:hypothetical protein
MRLTYKYSDGYFSQIYTDKSRLLATGRDFHR